MNARISLAEKLVGKARLFYELFTKTMHYSLVAYSFIENWYDALLVRAGLKKEVGLRLRPRVKPTWFVNSAIRMFDKNLIIPTQEPKGGRLSIEYAGKRIWLSITDSKQLEEMLLIITEQFLEEQYKWLDVQGKQVVDIGAGFGDTPIYFVLRGAKKVVAFEPYPYAYRIANQNVRANGMRSRIVLLNQAVGGESGRITLSSGFHSGGKSKLRRSRVGKEIKVVTLKSVVKEFAIKNAVLKLDCEGDEYRILLNAGNATLRRFSQIMIEYHFGFMDLEKKLRSAGFRVRHNIPIYIKIANFKSNLYGLIFAERIS